MKPTYLRFHTTRCPGLALLFAGTCSLNAADVTLDVADTLGNSSFNTAGGWSDGFAPAAFNDYFVSIERLRTPANGDPHTFAGASLTLLPGGVLDYKGTGVAGTLTVENLKLDGGLVRHLNGAGDLFSLAGSIEVLSASTITAKQGPVTVLAPVTGTAPLTVGTADNLYQVTLSGGGGYAGTITVQAGGYLTLAETGALAFKLTPGGSNMVTGGGTFAANGVFDIDVSSAGGAIGDEWLLVDDTTLAASFGETFRIVSGSTEWTRIPITTAWSVWVAPGGEHQFDTTTGMIVKVPADFDADGLPNTWEGTHFGNILSAQGAMDDPDEDGAPNYLEFLAGTDPNDEKSFPDADEDGLPDAWEYLHFGDLAQGPDGDPDGDLNGNLEEYLAGTSPTNAFDYPDADDDGLNDGWEVFHFGLEGEERAETLARVAPGADPDGDLFDNEAEFLARTDPDDPLSSPDTDGDGLPDGWEVLYFREGDEDLATVVGKYGGNDDPDDDGFSNFLEFAAGTDPGDASSGEKTVGYWRFEEASSGEVPAGGNGAYAFPTSVQDSSVYGNHMMAWADYSRPNYDALVPAAQVPATAAGNTGSLYFQRNGNGIYYIEALFTTPANLLTPPAGFLRTFAFQEITVETSFRTTLANAWQVPVSKLGNPVAGQPPFSLKIDTANRLRAGLVDGSGTAREIVGTSDILTGEWYSSAVTVSADSMKLWLKRPGDTAYQLEGEVAVSGAWYVPDTGAIDTAWNIGQGMWNGVATDAFEGNIDEVRISAKALDPAEFLFTEEAAGDYEAWAAATIPDAGLRGPDDDADGDGTTNFVEYRLGLNPVDGSSFFLASWEGTGLTWPAAEGLVFRIHRSTTLAEGSWEPVGEVTATGASATWSDPEAPAGRAFYRVELAD